MEILKATLLILIGLVMGLFFTWEYQVGMIVLSMVIAFASQGVIIDTDEIFIPGIFISIGSIIGSLISLKFAIPILKIVVAS